MTYNSVTCFSSPLFFFFTDSANGKIMVLLSSVLFILLTLPAVGTRDESISFRYIPFVSGNSVSRKGAI